MKTTSIKIATPVLIALIALLFTGLEASADAIFLKNGRIIEPDRCWETNDDVHFVLHGSTLKINKAQVERVEYDDGPVKTKDPNDPRTLEKMVDKYTTRNSVVYLNNGVRIKTKKTWLENDRIACQTKGKLIYLNAADIDKIVPELDSKDHARSPGTKTRQLQARMHKDDLNGSRTGPQKDFLSSGILVKYIGLYPDCPFNRRSDRSQVCEWYETEKGVRYYWHPSSNKLIRAKLRKTTNPNPGTEKAINQLESEEPPMSTFIRHGARFQFMGYKKIRSYKDPYKIYRTENHTYYYWDYKHKKLIPCPNCSRYFMPR